MESAELSHQLAIAGEKLRFLYPEDAAGSMIEFIF
jgi:hypothetical protein